MTMARKKTSTKKGSTMKVGSIKKASQIGSGPRRRGSKYDPIIDQMAKLKRNEGFVVEVPKNLPVATLMNRLNVTINRYTNEGRLAPPAGCEFLKRTTSDGNLAILCVPVVED